MDYDGGDCCLPKASKQYFFSHHDYQDYVYENYNVSMYKHTFQTYPFEKKTSLKPCCCIHTVDLTGK